MDQYSKPVCCQLEKKTVSRSLLEVREKGSLYWDFHWFMFIILQS